MSEIKYEIIKKIGLFSSFSEGVLYYGKVVTALGETIRLMAEVDGVIESAGGWAISRCKEIRRQFNYNKEVNDDYNARVR